MSVINRQKLKRRFDRYYLERYHVSLLSTERRINKLSVKNLEEMVLPNILSFQLEKKHLKDFYTEVNSEQKGLLKRRSSADKKRRALTCGFMAVSLINYDETGFNVDNRDLQARAIVAYTILEKEWRNVGRFTRAYRLLSDTMDALKSDPDSLSHLYITRKESYLKKLGIQFMKRFKSFFAKKERINGVDIERSNRRITDFKQFCQDSVEIWQKVNALDDLPHVLKNETAERMKQKMRIEYRRVRGIYDDIKWDFKHEETLKWYQTDTDALSDIVASAISEIKINSAVKINEMDKPSAPPVKQQDKRLDGAAIDNQKNYKNSLENHLSELAQIKEKYGQFFSGCFDFSDMDEQFKIFKKELKDQYHKVALAFHPDRNIGNEEICQEYFTKYTACLNKVKIEIYKITKTKQYFDPEFEHLLEHEVFDEDEILGDLSSDVASLFRELNEFNMRLTRHEHSIIELEKIRQAAIAERMAFERQLQGSMVLIEKSNAVIEELRKQGVEADKSAAEAKKSAAEAERRTAELIKSAAEAEKRNAELNDKFEKFLLDRNNLPKAVLPPEQEAKNEVSEEKEMSRSLRGHP